MNKFRVECFGFIIKKTQGVWHDLMMGNLLKLNNDHRIGLVCDVGLEVQLIDVRRRYPASIGKKIRSACRVFAGQIL